MLPLVLATRNSHKTAEFCALLGKEFAVEDLWQYPALPAPVEDGRSFSENAAIKAVAASRQLQGRWVVADDSGLEVDALDGAPGIFSARYAGEEASDGENVAKLLFELGKIPNASRRARFQCVLALARDGEARATYDGCVEGKIAVMRSGDGGFGYDPVFVPAGYEMTFAELSAGTKNEISHRARAVAELKRVLSELPPGQISAEAPP